MAEWRALRHWSNHELKTRVDGLLSAHRNFDAAEAEMTGAHGWHHYHSEALIARARAGEQACFDRACVALANYQFSDPAIVLAHFDPAAPLLGRRILLEIKALGLHYLCPALVTIVRDEDTADGHVFAFRYDTMEGHIERGVEWFQLTRSADGAIRFRIEARWRRGELPNWWSRVGFTLLSGHYQRRWHRQAHRRMSLLAHYGSLAPPPVDAAQLTHQGLDIRFTYHTKRKLLT